jgi:hypothetical protein
MADKTWKAFERRVAKIIGGVRHPITGREGPDVTSQWLSVECKHRKKLPSWMRIALDGVRAQTPKEKLGIVVIHEKGRQDSYVLLSLSDFKEWFIGTNDEDLTSQKEECETK